MNMSVMINGVEYVPATKSPPFCSECSKVAIDKQNGAASLIENILKASWGLFCFAAGMFLSPIARMIPATTVFTKIAIVTLVIVMWLLLTVAAIAVIVSYDNFVVEVPKQEEKS